jgi:4-carboxymuconolactone decarboxylase
MPNKRFEDGEKIRRAVVGDKFVDTSTAEADEFLHPFEELVTEYAWGTVWSRPGLSLKMRSLITLAMLTASNCPRQLKLHIQGALNNGCTKEEIRETLLQAAIYCGVPAASNGLQIAKQVFAELGSCGVSLKAEKTDP